MGNFSKKVMESREYAEDWIQAAEAALTHVESALMMADRDGAKTDSPEGVRYIKISDTMANELSSGIRMVLDGDGGCDLFGTDYKGVETSKREHKAIEIDGPTLSLFPVDLCGERDVNIYKTIVYRAKKPDVCILAMEAALIKIRAQSNIIIYRVRPSLEPVYNGDEYIYHQCRCRLTTIPDLTHEQWDDIGIKKEGEEVVIV